MLSQYQYDVGDLVQLVRMGKVYHVTWRGQMKVQQPNGVVLRVNVYRLDNGFWDCYHEQELTTAWRWGEGY
jgi:hypothetical protein